MRLRFGTLLFLFFMYVIIPLDEHKKDYWDYLLTPKHIIASLCAGLIWGLLMYYFLRPRKFF